MEYEIKCDECNTSCKIIYEIIDVDEFHDGTEQIPVGAECPKCGWGVC